MSEIVLDELFRLFGVSNIDQLYDVVTKVSSPSSADRYSKTPETEWSHHRRRAIYFDSENVDCVVRPEQVEELVKDPRWRKRIGSSVHIESDWHIPDEYNK